MYAASANGMQDIRYLTPIMKQVEKELAEKKKWNSLE